MPAEEELDPPPTPPVESYDGYKALIFDQSGVDYAERGGRRGIDPKRIGAASWTIEAKGGFGEFSLPLHCRTTELTEIVQGDRVEIWDRNLLVYVGNVEERGRQVGKPDELLVKGYGPLFRMEKLPARINQGRGDIADLAAALIATSVTPYLSGLVLDLPSSTGIVLESLTSIGKSVAQALSDLVAYTGGAWVWGVDVDSSYTYRLYLRAVATTTTQVIAVPGARTLAATGMQNGADCTNRAFFRGGDAVYGGNLLKNPSFEKPKTADEDASLSLLLNGGFEDGSPDVDNWSIPNWTRENAAAVKQRGVGGHPDPFDGDWHVQTDDLPGGGLEAFYQTVVTSAIVAGHRYQLVCHARPGGTSIAAGSVELYWRNSGGSLVLTNPDGSGLSWLPIDITVSAYEKYVGLWTAPAGVTGVRVRATRNASGGIIYWDQFSLFDLDSGAQESWKASLIGTPTATINWAYTGASFDGGMCVRVVTSGADSSNRVRIQPTETSTVIGGARYLFSLWYQSTTAPEGTMEIEYFKQDGSRARIESVAFAPGSSVTSWTTLTLFSTAPTDAVSAKVRLYLESDGTWLLDAFTLSDVRGLTGIPGLDMPYQEGTTLGALYKAEDLVTALEDAEVHGSFAALGWREATGEVRAESITTLADLAQFAKSWFLTRARAQRQPSVTVTAPASLLWPTDLVRLVGDDGPQLTGGNLLPVARIRGSGGQIVTYALELGREQPTIEALIQQAARAVVSRPT